MTAFCLPDVDQGHLTLMMWLYRNHWTTLQTEKALVFIQMFDLILKSKQGLCLKYLYVAIYHAYTFLL